MYTIGELEQMRKVSQQKEEIRKPKLNKMILKATEDYKKAELYAPITNERRDRLHTRKTSGRTRIKNLKKHKETTLISSVAKVCLRYLRNQHPKFQLHQQKT